MATSSTNTSQSDGASSSLIGNKRGPTRGENVKRLRKQMGGVRLTVEFCEEFRQAIGPNAEKFNNECGIICRKECPFEYVDWRKVPKSVKASLHERILLNFDVDLSSKIVVDVIDFQMGRSFKNHRAKLQEHFTKCHGEEDVERAKGLKPTDSNIKEDAWHKLCDYWSSEKFHVSSFTQLYAFKPCRYLTLQMIKLKLTFLLNNILEARHQNTDGVQVCSY